MMKSEKDQFNCNMRKYPGKLLLFGEYGLMFGAKALTIPFDKFSGCFSKISSDSIASQKESAYELEKFIKWYSMNKLNEKMNYPIKVAAFQKSLFDGLYFESNIPLQYGVGSSGALCAAIYNQFGIFNLDTSNLSSEILMALRDDFSLLESYFHGRSSGLDPLVSFLNRPILLENNSLQLVDLKIEELPWQILLLDTKLTSPTSPLVKLFIEKMEVDSFRKIFNDEYVAINNQAIEAMLTKDSTIFFESLSLINQFQLENLREMIPEEIKKVFESSRKDQLLLKLLGSGGGGFMLGFHPAKNKILEIKNSFQIN